MGLLTGAFMRPCLVNNSYIYIYIHDNDMGSAPWGSDWGWEGIWKQTSCCILGMVVGLMLTYVTFGG